MIPARAPIAVATELRVAWDADSLFREFAPYVAQVARRLMRRASDVDDVVQDVFFQAMLHVHQLRDTNAVKGWLKTSTVRVCLRKLKRQRVLEWIGLDDVQVSASGVTQDNAAMLRRAEQALREVPVEARAA